MSDDLTTGTAAVGGICPWCSAPLAATDTENCPACGATLKGESEANLPGLTAVDPMAVLEGTREPRRPRNRLVAWLTGDDIDDAATATMASPEALAPPPIEVRREILRLQVEAELTQRTAEVGSMAADEAVALAESGDSASAQAAVAAIIGSDQLTDDLVESPEEGHLEAASGVESEAAAAETLAEAPGNAVATQHAEASEDAAADADSDEDRPTDA